MEYNMYWTRYDNGNHILRSHDGVARVVCFDTMGIVRRLKEIGTS